MHVVGPQVLDKRRSGGVDTIVVLMTDGAAQDKGDIESAAKKIHDMGVQVSR